MTWFTDADVEAAREAMRAEALRWALEGRFAVRDECRTLPGKLPPFNIPTDATIDVIPLEGDDPHLLKVAFNDLVIHHCARAVLAAIPDPRARDRLNEADSVAFVSAILDPPEPNDSLNVAAERYKARTLPCGHTAAEVADLCRLLAQSADRGQTNNYTEIADIARRAEEAIRWLLAIPDPRAAGFIAARDEIYTETARMWPEAVDLLEYIAALKPGDKP